MLPTVHNEFFWNTEDSKDKYAELIFFPFVEMTVALRVLLHQNSFHWRSSAIAWR